jgi:ABC-type molybdate transport system permease subunit
LASSFFTRMLDVPDEPASFFSRRRQVLRATVEGACDSPMMMPPVVRGVLSVDEEERDEEDVTLSIRHSAVS